MKELHDTGESIPTMTRQDTAPIGGADECSQVEQLFWRLSDAAEDHERREWRRQIITANYSVGSHQRALDGRYVPVQDAMALARPISELPHHQQLILKTRFCDCLVQPQIGQYFGISQVQEVSHLFTATLQCLCVELVGSPTGEPQHG